ncbi:hypothetical protein [Methylobacterium gnaphalii]|uniref:Uncharacterized protein n=1 Tax=Methylobacterium gnaphalii TaxID=1010610 RepID=A0A512JS14_9HYPH|nr:hypothetical protein [Methylobacterium gnaphalii]GEP12754.1 hypothetical protein MGN01_45990 [Methylobacterium gnaphalii]GJD70507.1 hypothetical protein MMMDOFMJ_3456 [Methylobacterium gnaphalii]GLS49146.1 hypothetical protein GCM10007885_19940 [Methylobacterium gnaphalii]
MEVTALPSDRMRAARLAQIALEAYFQGRTDRRRGGGTAGELEWSESDIVDLVTDLFILARAKDVDLSGMLAKIEAHIQIETGRQV